MNSYNCIYHANHLKYKKEIQNTPKEESSVQSMAEVKHQKNSSKKPAHSKKGRRGQNGSNLSGIFETDEDHF